jgi:hypothetical protein
MHELYQENMELWLAAIINKFNYLVGSKFLEIGLYDFNRAGCQNYGAWRGW